jgi:hypothetical protein
MLGDPLEVQRHDRLTLLRLHLPMIDQVHRLKALFFMHAAPMCVKRAFALLLLSTPVCRKSPLLVTDFDTIVSAVYHQSPWTLPAPDAADLHEHHWLAVIFLVCAIGSCMSCCGLTRRTTLMSTVQCSIHCYHLNMRKRTGTKSWALQPCSVARQSTIPRSKPSKQFASCLRTRDTPAQIITRIPSSGRSWGKFCDLHLESTDTPSRMAVKMAQAVG